MTKIESLLNPKYKSNIISCIKQGYQIKTKLFTTEPIFSFSLSTDHESNIIRLATDFTLYNACKHGLLPFDATIALNAKKNCKHLELRGGSLVITTNKTNYQNEIPRDAIFRNQHANNSQLDLFIDKVLPPENAEIYACITHGSSNGINPDFITFGIPDKSMKCWIESKNMLNDIHIHSINELEAEFDIDEITLEFKHFVNQLNIFENDKE
jgi:hypothetical protein